MADTAPLFPSQESYTTSILVLPGKQVAEMDSLSYSDSCISPDDLISDTFEHRECSIDMHQSEVSVASA